MRIRLQCVSAITVAVLLVIFTGIYAVADESKTGGKQRVVSKLELRISDDGKSIVDQSGKEVARFVEGTRVQTMPKMKDQKLQGCMRCWDECLVYDGERCVKWIRTCQWDFDCK
ncbi:MAG: hypothetical protein AB1473_01805 [Thermodesulfobacteriota bacterium]